MVLANDYIGASFGSAGVDYDSDQKSADGYVFGRFFYGRHISDLISIETGFMTGSSIDTDEDDDDIIKQDDLDIDVFFVHLKAGLKLNDKHALFTKVGANAYYYEIQNENQASTSEEGLGYSLSAGWEYTLNNAFTTGIELKNMTMGDMDAGSLNFDLMYHF
jgi:hypothetical protein